MKSIVEMTDEQCIEIAKLAMQDIISQNWFMKFIRGGKNVGSITFNVKRELFDEKENLMVVRVYINEIPDSYIAIWEDDFNVETYIEKGNSYETTANIVQIVKKFIEWGFV